MAERQSDHRRGLEKRVVDANCSSQKLGLILGFIVAMTAVCGGIWLISQGKDAVGISSIVTALTALAGAFIYGKKKQSDEIAQKTEAINRAIPK